MKLCMCGLSVVPGETGIETEDGDLICDWCIEERAMDHVEAVRYECADNALGMREGW